MKWLVAIAALLMAGTAAQAQYTFEYNGKTIRIDPDRGTVSIPGVFDNTKRPSKRSRNDQDKSRKPLPDQAKTDPQAPAAAPGQQPEARQEGDSLREFAEAVHASLRFRRFDLFGSLFEKLARGT